MKKWMVFVAAAALLVPASSIAQKPPTQGAAIIGVTATIDSIDVANRTVMVKDLDGFLTPIRCGPEVKRFDELKVGQKVTFRFYESVLQAIQKPGEPPPASGGKAVTPGQGAKPGGTVSEQVTTTVTVETVNTKAPSLVVITDRGTRMNFKVADKKILDGIAPGQAVQITYTRALAISVQ
jgi:hypothetical protein